MKRIIIFVCVLFAYNNAYAADIIYNYGILDLKNLSTRVSDQYDGGYVSQSSNAFLIEKTDQIVAKPNLGFGVIVDTPKRVKIHARWLYPRIDEKTNKEILKSFVYEERDVYTSTFYYFVFEEPDGENTSMNGKYIPKEGKYTLEVFVDETKEFRCFDFYVTNQ